MRYEDNSWRPRRFQYLRSVRGNLDATPRTAELAGLVEQEGAALDPAHLASVHVLVADHVEHSAEHFLLVGNQVERQLLALAEALVAGQRVAGNADDANAGGRELARQVAEVARLERATAGGILRVEIQDSGALAQRLARKRAAGRRQFEVRQARDARIGDAIAFVDSGSFRGPPPDDLRAGEGSPNT